MAIETNTGFKIGSSSPIDNRQYLNKQDMLNINDNIMPDVYFAVCIDDGKFYLYNKTNTPNVDTGKFIACNMKDSYTKGEVDALLASINHQITSFPVASIDYVGKIYQYIGATTNDYINGYYYTCKQFDIYQCNLATVDGTTTGTYYNNDGTVTYTLPNDYVDGTDYYTRTLLGSNYKWSTINVQPSYSKASEISYDDTKTKLGANDVQTAIVELNGNIQSIDMVKSAPSDPIYSAYYNLTYNGVPVGDTIKVLNQILVNSGEIKECTTDNDPINGLRVGETYIDLELANGQGTHIYIKVNDLTSSYLNDMDDVLVTNPQDEEHLVYDSTTRKWVNKAFTIQPSFSFTEYTTNTEIIAMEYYVYNNELYQALVYIPASSNTSFNSSLFKLIIGGNGGVTPTVIPIATQLQLGGIKVGDHLSITTDGTLSVVVDKFLDASSSNPLENATVTSELGKKIDKPSNTPTDGQVLSINSGKPTWTSLPTGVVGIGSINTSKTPDVNGNVNLNLDDIPDGTNRILTSHWVGTKQDLLNLIASGNYDPNGQYDTTDENDNVSTIQPQQVDSALNSQSQNAIANSAVTNAINGKMDKPINQGQPNQFYGLNANGVAEWKTVQTKSDSALSTTSTNSVENRIITSALNNKIDKPSVNGNIGQVLTIDTNGEAIWKDASGGSGTVKSVNTITPNTTTGDVAINLDNVPNGNNRKITNKWIGTKSDLDALGAYDDNTEYFTTDEDGNMPSTVGKVVPYSQLEKSSYVYSTTETLIGEYLNKPLYRKVVKYSNCSFSNTLTLPQERTFTYNIPDIDVVVNWKFTFTDNSGTSTRDFLNYNYYDSDFKVTSRLGLRSVSRDRITITYENFKQEQTFYNIVLILEYIKR